MNLLYYRNFRPGHFLSEADFDLSSKYKFEVEHHYRFDKENKEDLVTISIAVSKLQNFAILAGTNTINDAKVTVGANGVGKSTLFDEIIAFISQSDLSISWQVLIGEKFILVGDKVRIEEDSLNSIQSSFKDIQLCRGFSGQEYLSTLNVKVLTSGNSFIQAKVLNESSLIYYSNSLENNKLPNLAGELYTRSQTTEEAIALVDISTSNFIVQSNKWGIESRLKNIIAEENMLSLDNYQMHNFLELYFKTSWFSQLLPQSIKDKMEVRVHFGSLIQRFDMLVHSVFGFEFIQKSFPKYYQLQNKVHSNFLYDIYKELIAGIILKVVDKNYDNRGFFECVFEVLEDFEKSIPDVKATEKGYQADELSTFVNLYCKNSKLASSINASSILHQFEVLLKFLVEADKIKQQVLFGGLHDYSGIILNLKADYSVISELVELYSVLQSNENFQIPFLKFSPNRISAGERNYLFLLSRLMRNIDTLDEVAGRPFNFTLLMDEPGNDYHPQWQKQFFNNLNNALNSYSINKRKIEVQLIISTHSPFILSDFDSNSIIKIKKLGERSVTEPYGIETFGANIYDLLADNFYMVDGFIGDFAQNKIQDLINFLNYKSNKEEDESNIKPSEEWTLDAAREMKELIGEPFLKEQIRNLFYKKYPEEYNKEKKIRELENEIDRIKNA